MTISKQQILSGDLSAFSTVLNTHFIDADYAAERPMGELSAENCLKFAQSIKGHASLFDFSETSYQQLLACIAETQIALSLADQAYIRFCYAVLMPYPKALQWDQALNDDQAILQKQLFLQALADADFWIKPHPLKNLTDYLYLNMLGWQLGFAHHSEQLLQVFQDAIKAVDRVVLTDKAGFTAIEQQLKIQFAEFQQSIDRFAQRMKDAESGKIKNRASQLEAYSFISKLTQGKKLPTGLAQFLHQELVMDLHVMLIAQGLDSRVWQQLKQLLTQLVNMYQPGTNIDSNHKQLPLLLQTFIDEYLRRTDTSDMIINQVAFDLSQLSVGKPVADCMPVEKFVLPAHLHNTERQVSQQLIQHSRQFKENHWFLLRDENGQFQRCKLLLQLPEYDQLLFSNFVGQRVLAASQGDFAYLLSARHMQPLSMYGGLTRTLHSQLDQLLDGFDEKFNNHSQAIEKIKQERINLKLQAERQAAAEKARFEAEQLAKQKAAAERKAQLEQASADLKRHARLSLDSLTLGAWVEFLEASGSYKRAKLAVKFNATGRFVFVDENGITVADRNRDELIMMMLDDSLKLLESDKKFAERLARIVADIRTAQE